MSGIPKSRRLWITPLSPVHMGTDEDYAPTNYVMEDDALYEFDETGLSRLPQIERDKLQGILKGKATPDMLKKVQGFFFQNRERLLPGAINIVRVSEELAALYRARVGKAANIESGGREAQNKLEIERASYNPADRRLYLPGTGLKGAIRTALLDSENDGAPARRNTRNRDLQQDLFKYSMRDLHKDPMRLVQVGDSAWHGPEGLNSAEILFAVNRKKNPVQKNGELIQSKAEKENLYQLLECAAPFRFRAFQGLLNITDLADVGKNHPGTPELRFSFEDIATACNRFYRPVFDREIETLRKRGYLDTEWRSMVNDLLDGPELKKRLDANEAFLLRVGRHSGAESVTLNGVRSIRIMQGRGEKPTWEPSAKTLWLATGSRNDQRYLRPFGWLLVEMTKMGELPPASPLAERLTEIESGKATQWLEGIKANQIALGRRIAEQLEAEESAARDKAAREAAEAKKQLAEQQRLEAEQKAKEEALQRMDPLEREIETYDQVVDAIKALQDGHWSEEESTRAAQFIKQRMQREGTWHETSKKKKPEKDKPYQRTLSVMKFLD